MQSRILVVGSSKKQKKKKQKKQKQDKTLKKPLECTQGGLALGDQVGGSLEVPGRGGVPRVRRLA